jgi:hypothetical protein
MTSGLPINRQWIIVLNNGTPIYEWEPGLAVDLYSGEFINFATTDFSHAVQDSELETLKRAGRVVGFDQNTVFVMSLPELPSK